MTAIELQKSYLKVEQGNIVEIIVRNGCFIGK